MKVDLYITEKSTPDNWDYYSKYLKEFKTLTIDGIDYKVISLHYDGSVSEKEIKVGLMILKKVTINPTLDNLSPRELYRAVKYLKRLGYKITDEEGRML